MLIVSLCAFYADTIFSESVLYCLFSVTVYIVLPIIYIHFVHIYYRQGYFTLGKQNGAIHIFRFTKMIFHFLFYLFGVNCAFFAVRYFSIATKFCAVSLGCFALCGERHGTLSP